MQTLKVCSVFHVINSKALDAAVMIPLSSTTLFPVLSILNITYPSCPLEVIFIISGAQLYTCSMKMWTLQLFSKILNESQGGDRGDGAYFWISKNVVRINVQSCSDNKLDTLLLESPFLFALKGCLVYLNSSEVIIPVLLDLPASFLHLELLLFYN